MALTLQIAIQILQIALLPLLAPGLTGLVRKVKARLLGRRGPPLLQPYRDLLRLVRKQPVVADTTSWLFRAIPYIVFALIWVAASLVPTFAGELVYGPAADLIAIIALLGTARFALALGGLDAGTAFGGIGASRDMMVASLAEPAMLMMVFALSLLAGTTELGSLVTFLSSGHVGLRVTLALALLGMLIVSLAENARIPVDNPATHLELTMIHEAMVLEYSGRHLALIEAAAQLKLLFYASLLAALFAPWGMAQPGDGLLAVPVGILIYLGKLAVAGALLATLECSIAKMRVFRVSELLGGALVLGLLGVLLLFVSRSF